MITVLSERSSLMQGREITKILLLIQSDKQQSSKIEKYLPNTKGMPHFDKRSKYFRFGVDTLRTGSLYIITDNMTICI